MKKAYLLVGSVGLLGAIAQVVPALAAKDPGSVQDGEEITTSSLKALSIIGGVETAALLAIESAASRPTSVVVPMTQPESILQNQPSTLSDNLVTQGGTVTSVSQLSDVQPSDWAFQALRSLIERRGCIAGYSDRTYQGDRALTRYEFAAGTYACLNSLAARVGQLSPDELATITRLKDEFAAELAPIRSRVGMLEPRTTELEINQFSTTTKLQGEIIFAPQYGEFGGAGRSTVIGYALLYLNTSFTGDDLLSTQLAVGNNGQDALTGAGLGSGPENSEVFFGIGDDERLGVPVVDPGQVAYAEYPSQAYLETLYYTFKPIPDLAITVGPRIYPSYFVDFNSYANLYTVDFSSGLFVNNPLIVTNYVDYYGGAGAAIDWNFGGGPITLRAVYNSVDSTLATATSTGGGLFGDPYQGTVELEFSQNDTFAVRLQYTDAAINDIRYDIYGVNAELTLGSLGIFGRYARGGLNAYGIATASGIPDTTPETFMAGVAIRDLLTPSSLLGFAIGQPFIEDRVGNATQTNYEAFYNFPLNDNITVTPVLMVVTNANNDSANSTIYQGLLRTVFSF